MKRIENDNYIIEVNEIGAELTRVFSKTRNIEYIWGGDERYWKGHSPILFPFVGRMLDQQYSYQGKLYPMTKHGFARSVEYEVSEGDDKLVFSHTNTNENYPFPCRIEITYSLSGDVLSVDHRFINTGDRKMRYGFGAHPGFNVPLNRELAFEDYYLYFPEAGKTRQKLFSEDFLDSGLSRDYPLEDGKLPLRHSLFDNDAVVIENGGYEVSIRSDKDPHSVTVRYPAIPYCGFWHAMQTDAPYVCVEPWRSMPGPAGRILDLETKEDFLDLEPGEERVHTITIEFR